VRLPAIWVLGGWIALQFLSLGSIAVDGESVAWWAHIGGFAAGVALVFPLRKHEVSHEKA
jgi:membrane associated rhomboid family serine protease